MPFPRFLLGLSLIVLFATGSFAASRPTDDKQQAAALFEQGQNEQAKGNLNNAVRIYTQAISMDSGLYQAYYQRAIALIDLEQTGEAESDLRKAVQIQPDFARAHRALGQLLLDRGVTDEARKELGRAIELDPKLKGARLYYASALIKSGDPSEALTQLQGAIDQGEADAQTYALMGLAQERTGKKQDAVVSYSKALQLNANDVVALEGRGRLEAEQGDNAKAAEDLGAAYKIVPSPDLALTLARLYMKSGQVQPAIQIYSEQVRQRPEDIGLRMNLVRLLAQNGHMEDARKDVAVLLKLRPKDFYIQMLAGELYSDDSPAAAAGYYKAAMEIDPNKNEARVGYGSSLVRSAQYQEALPVLQQALTVDPDNLQAHKNLATALFELKQYPVAAPQFLWVVQRKPSLAIAFYFLAISLDKSGDCYDALRSYKEFGTRADPVVNPKEIEDARIRVSLLDKLVKHGKCNPLKKDKK